MRKGLLIFLIVPFILSAQTSRDSLFIHGIQKDWSPQLVEEYKAWEKVNFYKPSEGALRQSAIMNGNKITTEIWNFGSISSPGNRITDIVWEGLGYGYEFGPFVASEVEVPPHSHPDAQIKRDKFGRVVTKANGDTVWIAHVISDGLKSNGGEVAPDLKTRWGWQPLVQSDDGKNEYLNLESIYIPTSDDRDRNGDGRPDSWPTGWYNDALRAYVWPGALGQGATNADKEAFFVMDDRDNREFLFYPYPKTGYTTRTARIDSGETAHDGLLYLIDPSGGFGSDLMGGGNIDADAVVLTVQNSDRYYLLNSVISSDTLQLKAAAPYANSDTTISSVVYNIRDGLRRGLGLEVEARYYQWANVQAEDAIFLIYKIKNKGHFDLEKVIFGMWGDPHIGGPDDWRDDWANFDKQLEMTFAWDDDGKSVNNPDIVPGYLGYKFLESPGVSTDGIDNDNDGMVDESWTDGIDNDHDWDPENDDVGVDGIPNTGDEGEKDGLPTAGDPFDISKPGEPNFEFTDIDESDMLGLTSFAQPSFSGLNISEDEKMWRDYIQPGQFDTTQVQGDYVFLYGSGIFNLRSIYTVDETQISEAIKRFSIALIIGQDKNDLVLNAETVQKIYNSGYQFAKPPAKPHLSVVPGDRKVTLYWDDVAENSVDPISKQNDFEGYIIYRSTDPGFLDQQTITDVNGNRFLFAPLKTAKGANAQFDLVDGIVGPSTIPYAQRGVAFYMGDDTGLRHVFVDSNHVINGQTYFYAVVSYDRGDDSLRIPPSVCSKIISYNPTTNEYSFDINTAKVIPRRRAAGYVPGTIKDAEINGGIVRKKGFSTGTFTLEIIDDRATKDNDTYNILFHRSDSTGTDYSVEDTKRIEETFVSFYGNYVALAKAHINDTSVVVTDMSGEQTFEAGVDYEMDGPAGTILVYDPAETPGARMQDNTQYKISYTYFPVYKSTALNGELTNPIFDGIRLAIKQASFGWNKELSGWSASSQTNLQFQFFFHDNYAPEDPFDYEITFYDHIVDTSVTNMLLPFKVLDVLNNTYMKIATSSSGEWQPGNTFFILRGGERPGNIVWEVTSAYPENQEVKAPTAGDVYYFATDKPFQDGDVFSFSTIAPQIDREVAKTDLDKINVVPNPYVATNVIEPSNKISRTSRGYRRLYFDHLPPQCTIRIYTQAGELVRVLQHNSGLDDGKEFWDLLTKDNMEVAYGLYFFHVEAPGLGEKVGKFVIIK